MSKRDFERISSFVEEELGVKMPPVKKTLLESRLQKRLRANNIGAFSEYCDYVFSDEGIANELIYMIDLVTTHKTDFFREPEHFDYLLKHALPELVKKTGAGIKNTLMLWSAGCSTGEEPYTLAMVLNEFAGLCRGAGFKYEILATDVSAAVLKIAGRAIYSEDSILPVPMGLRKKYLLRSRDASRKIVRITPELRERVRFRRLNFMDDDFGFREQFDIIFCRNVVIYFDKAIQARLYRKFYKYMKPDGFFFMGHSETMSNIDTPLVKAAQAVYRKQ